MKTIKFSITMTEEKFQMLQEAAQQDKYESLSQLLQDEIDKVLHSLSSYPKLFSGKLSWERWCEDIEIQDISELDP
jgi:hypothetical protein